MKRKLSLSATCNQCVNR